MMLLRTKELLRERITFLVLGALLAGALSVIAWTDPTLAPPNGAPSKSAARGTLSANQVVTTGTETKVNLNAETYDVKNEFSTSTGRFTATVAGYYLVIGQVQYLGTASGSRDIAYLRKNGSTYNAAINTNAGGGSDTSTYAWDVMQLNPNDYVELYTSHERGSDATINSDSRYTHLTVAIMP